MLFFNISPTAAILTIIILALILVYQYKDKYPLGCTVVIIAFVVFTVKTCNELDEEEKAEQKRSEELIRKLEQEKLEKELRKELTSYGYMIKKCHLLFS